MFHKPLVAVKMDVTMSVPEIMAAKIFLTP